VAFDEPGAIMLWPDKLLVVLIGVAAPAPLPFAAAFVWRGDLASQAEMGEKMMLRLFEEAGSIVFSASQPVAPPRRRLWRHCVASNGARRVSHYTFTQIGQLSHAHVIGGRR